MKSKILVVDDNQFILDLMTYILDNEGYHVEVSDRADGLLNKIEASNPSLIILDVSLPDGDGRDLCRQIKESNAMKSIPVVMCSGRHDIDDLINQSNPPDGLLPKPFDMNQLLQMVQSKLALAA
ncbi:response regulator [Mucilaginibacter sp. Bleaf8]|uniref:response regulator transcription factor n=1 Tax=Mucilaginibacter sp. Bleaf8 TaxID=2834430 RepID=UPI001BCF1DAC|nr:response regulator [Mucilaginibacter sp. Bleaf8]MBS7564556.1 response regulator [Mucilaginibacter sp. Bleaf8]